MREVYVIGLLLCYVLGCSAQDSQSQMNHGDHFSVGLSAGEFSYDSWLGVEMSTPQLFQDLICFRVKASRNWLEDYKIVYDHWATYSTVAVSVVISTGITRTARWYLDVGPFIVFPQDKISARKSVKGISALQGFELSISETNHLSICYYFGGGIAYSAARAEKIGERPSYAKGIVFSTGFRFYF